MNTSKQSKSKPITTSVPTFAIRFHASGEELEELYPSEEEEKSEKSISEDKIEKSSEKVPDKAEKNDSDTAKEPNKHESSPMRDYLNKFGKRSSSIDTGINESTLNKETSDPWRIFSEFKGKLTKTVEEKLSEIKSKNSEGESSPKFSKNKSSSKDNSSVSDSEEQSFSECSIAKSSNLSSTAEDLEMSSDDENSLAESDKTPTETKEFSEPKKTLLRHRIKNKTFVEYRVGKEDTDSHVKISSLTTVLEKDGSTAEDDVESGVEACEELSTENGAHLVGETKLEDTVTLLAPQGFVDLRIVPKNEPNTNFRFYCLWAAPVIIFVLSYYFPIPKFILGFIFGCLITLGSCYIFYKIKLSDLEYDKNKIRRKTLTGTDLPVFEVPAVKEYQPMTKFEGWMNEYPDHYDPRTYHIMKTQSVFLKLEGSVLRVSHTRAKIPKRAMWDEPKHHATFTHHRMYNLKGSQIMLLPTGLIHKRLWSKKYPICIILNKEKMNLELKIERKDDDTETEDESKLKKSDNELPDSPVENEDDQIVEEEIFCESYSDAIMEEDNELSITVEDWDTLTLDETSVVETKLYLFARTCRDKEDWFRRLVQATHDASSEPEPTEENSETPISQPQSDQTDSTSIPLSITPSAPQEPPSSEANPAETAVKKKPSDDHEDYPRFMSKFNQVRAHYEKLHAKKSKRKLFRARKKKISQNEEETEELEDKELDNNLWVNSLIARVIYDVRKHNDLIEKFQNLIQKKISTIKLPYFIDSILLQHLTLGSSTPTISNIQAPVFDSRGLWLHLDVVYEGVTSMAIVTKLNLMKLKEQAGRLDESLIGCLAGEMAEEKSPIFHSDVEDSAESSDEEVWGAESVSAGDGSQNSTPRKPNTGGKKFLQMVDKIASSKYFQQATENKYIKRAMEGVSKTEIKLTVEIQHLSGTLAINIPPPPSDRMWIGFQGNPELQLSALPTFGERSLNFMHVSRWIEKKLAVEFQSGWVVASMHFWIDKRSGEWGRRGFVGKAPMVTPVHRFQAVEAVVGRSHHNHRYQPRHHHPRQPQATTTHEIDAFLDVTHHHIACHPGVAGPSLATGRFKCGMWASFALVTVFMAGAKFYFNTQSTGFEVLIFCALLIIVLFAGCAVSFCEAVTQPTPPQAPVVTTAPTVVMIPTPPPTATTSTASSSHNHSVQVTPGGHIEAASNVAPPPPYHIAVLLPPPPPPPQGPPSPPPTYDKAVTGS